jgi:hypothetical protein
MKTALIGAAMCCAMLTAAPAFAAATNLVVNGDFEASNLNPGDVVLNDLPGWTGRDPVGPFSWFGMTTIPLAAVSGITYAYINNASTSDTPAFVDLGLPVPPLPTNNNIAQQTSATLRANMTYDLSAWIGWRNDNPERQGVIRLWAGGTVAGGEVVGGTLLAETTLALTQGGFVQGFASYRATGGDPLLGQLLTVQLGSNSIGDFGGQTNVDAVSLTAVPEAATWAMLIGGFGLVGMAMRRRRDKAAAAA